MTAGFRPGGVTVSRQITQIALQLTDRLRVDRFVRSQLNLRV